MRRVRDKGECEKDIITYLGIILKLAILNVLQFTTILTYDQLLGANLGRNSDSATL